MDVLWEGNSFRVIQSKKNKNVNTHIWIMFEGSTYNFFNIHTIYINKSINHEFKIWACCLVYSINTDDSNWFLLHHKTFSYECRFSDFQAHWLDCLPSGDESRFFSTQKLLKMDLNHAFSCIWQLHIALKCKNCRRRMGLDSIYILHMNIPVTQLSDIRYLLPLLPDLHDGSFPL